MIGQDMVALAFWILLALSCAYAALFGGRDGRCASLMIILAAVASAWVQTSPDQWITSNLTVMAVDVALLVGLMTLMLWSKAFWPIWMSASQLMTVLTHVGTTLVFGFKPNIYAGLATIWVLPCLGSMVMGITLDWMQRRSAERATIPPCDT